MGSKGSNAAVGSESDKGWYNLQLTDDLAQRLDFLASARCTNWAGVIVHLVGVETTRAGYEPPTVVRVEQALG